MKKIKNFNDNIDELLSDIELPTDEEIKQDTLKNKQKQNGSKQGKINVLNKTVNKAGKASAKVNLLNGQLDKIRNLPQTKKAQSKVGKRTGKLNVVSGHLDKIRSDGGKAGYKSNLENGNFKKFQNKAYESTRKAVIATRIKDGKEFEFISISEAARVLNVHHGNIVKHLNGKGKSVGKHIFRYK